MANKKTSVPSTQRYLNIAHIRNGTIVTKTGLLRRIIHVEPVNFALKSDQDQNVIIGQYQNFLNSLNFPLQIVVHSRRLDVAPYLAKLKEKITETPNELLRFHGLEYIEFIKSLTDLANIMDKQFYCIVGYDPPQLNKSGLLGGIFGRKEQSKISFTMAEWTKASQELDQRVLLITNGLSAMGLKADPLTTQKSIELFYSVYNPEEANAEKLTEVERLEAPIISTQPVPTNTPALAGSNTPTTNSVPNTAQTLNAAPPTEAKS